MLFYLSAFFQSGTFENIILQFGDERELISVSRMIPDLWDRATNQYQC
jgi:hypothetical protein